VGHPLDPQTEVGPLIHARHADKVLSYFDIARQEGARIEVGGTRHAGQTEGFYISPTLLVGARPSMRIAQEEIFGPVLTVMTFDDEAQAVGIANDVPYGLAGYVWTGDLGRALRVSNELEAGMIWVNSENVRHLGTPFGGVKASGIGRDGGDYSFEFYMETKNVALAHGTHAIPRLAP
jgi:5-carboxymethyl-2-hydroxymuconic-semialdehyde dehydrogenase